MATPARWGPAPGRGASRMSVNACQAQGWETAQPGRFSPKDFSGPCREVQANQGRLTDGGVLWKGLEGKYTEKGDGVFPHPKCIWAHLMPPEVPPLSHGMGSGPTSGQQLHFPGPFPASAGQKSPSGWPGVRPRASLGRGRLVWPHQLAGLGGCAPATRGATVPAPHLFLRSAWLAIVG